MGIGIRLAKSEPRIAAAVLFAGSFVPRSMFEEARQVTKPPHVTPISAGPTGTSAYELDARGAVLRPAPEVAADEPVSRWWPG